MFYFILLVGKQGIGIGNLGLALCAMSYVGLWMTCPVLVSVRIGWPSCEVWKEIAAAPTIHRGHL